MKTRQRRKTELTRIGFIIMFLQFRQITYISSRSCEEDNVKPIDSSNFSRVLNKILLFCPRTEYKKWRPFFREEWNSNEKSKGTKLFTKWMNNCNEF